MMWIRQVLIAILAVSAVLHINMMRERIIEWRIWRHQFTHLKTGRRIRQKALRLTTRKIVLLFVGVVLETLAIVILAMPWVIS